MGVFARFFRRSEAVAETSVAEEPAGAATDDVQADGAAGDDSKAAQAGDDGAGAAPETGGADGVEIPKQQSADEAAEQETGKGART
ncbi:hypothetical protein GCM10023336_74100 [Streptomyces similanensis]|uniref:Gliding motility protein n=1 Tax=Streptomyces similanensis TaxID=1274988 RepID=A0ABP9LPZ4_9ACTN